ncbi:two-component system response regulator [uncultured Sphaerochaeta sp.]|uniref:HD-GYP domain-containing protein n=1 Tax=uncultured Sphaerochaeta sp. TaxID=886478 RepID=UPI002A0A1991|nr:two-component system response regulator [uncultured Sphaerochaeta sp.]
MESNNKNKVTILLVDDSPDSIVLLSSLLKNLYRVKIAITGEKALEVASGKDVPDLILLDIMMPGLDGYETCRLLKSNPKTAEIPIIFLTAKTGDADEEKGLALGAEDYIIKPPNPAILRARIKTHLKLKEVRDFLKDKNEYLEAEITRRTQEIKVIQDITMIAMGSLAEMRDNETGNHLRRTQKYIRILSERLRFHPRFKELLTEDMIDRLCKSAPLHDIGKVGIPDFILQKPGKLNTDEFNVMKTHTTIGRDAILSAEKYLDSSAHSSFLALARDIAWSHHERWDGSGYPQGLCGEMIPLSGRLMAIVDVYDALMSERVYKRAFTHEETVDIIKQGSGTSFDPDIVHAFLEISDKFFKIAEFFKDDKRSLL